MSSQKAFIESVRKEDFGIDETGKPTGLTPHMLSSFEGMLGLVSKELYSDSLHFVFELIQNAQDNTYADGVLPHLKFILLDHDPTNSQNSEGCLCVINNEKGFKESDIKSICSATRSTKAFKKADGFIGEKGIGFKSVFKVSSFPHIFSNGFQFRLLGDDKITGLSYIIPYWVDDIPDIVKENKNKTCILLPLIKDKYSEIRTSFLKYKSEVTLFLDKIQSVEITIPADNYEVVFTTSQSGNILQQVTTLNGNVSNEQKFYLANKIVPVPKKLNEEKRLGVTERTITVALPLDKYESHNVFSYLPTEMHSGLPFIINADFILAASRESIIKNSWNAWLFTEIAQLVVSQIASLTKSGLTNSNIYSFVPLRADAKKAGGVFLSLVDDVVEQLKTKEFVKDCSDNLRVPSAIRIVKKEFRELFCDASHSVNWLHTEPALHVNRLKQVGVKNITPTEQKLYYEQSDFIEKQDDGWFIKYVLYLAQLNQSDAKKFPCIPLEGGGLECLGSKSTYKPLETGKALVPSGIFFPKVKSLRQTLFDMVSSREDAAQILAHLSLQAFSYSHYVFEQISPTLDEKACEASLQEKRNLIDTIFLWWDVLEVDEDDEYEGYGLPVLLSDERLTLSDDLEYPIVLPEKSKSEWTYLFLSDFEKSQFSILSDYYFEGRFKPIEDYYNKIGVEKFPSPISSVQRAISEIGPNYKDYDKYLNDAFFQNSAHYQSTYIKTAEIKLMPSVFWRVEGLCNEEYQTLLEYFESQIVSDGRAINRHLRTVASYYYRSKKYQYFESTFNFFLKRVPWVKTNQGYRLPSQCFVDDPNLRQIFGSDFPYLSVQMPENLMKYLEVKRDAETKTIIEYLKKLNSSASVNIKTMIAIYTALSGRKDIDANDFSDDTLIYIPPNKRKEAQWCTSAQVIWDDVSKYIDDSVFDSLQSYYPEELKNFFVKKLNIKESMDASNYADLWINLQNKNQLSEREWNLYNKAFVIIASVIKKNERPKWLTEFKKEAKLYTNIETWVSADDEPQAFFPDETKLRTAFSTKITFVKKLEDHSYEWMLPLVKFLDFECFTDVVKEELISDNVTNLEPTNKILTDYSCKLIVRLLANKITQGRELVERLKADSHIEALLNFREARVREIKVRLFIPHTTISHITSTHTVFLDFKQKVLFLKNDADPDELRDDFERLFIAQVLRDYTSKLERDTLEDSISKMLGIVSKERFDKQMRRKPDWHTPRAVANHIDKIIKGRAIHELDIPVQQEVQQTKASEVL